MNLIVDQGNTLTKIAVFDRDELQYRGSHDNNDVLQELESLEEKFPGISHCILASVGDLGKDLVEYLESSRETMLLDHNTKVPFTNKYGTPETLGVDRIALVSAAVREYPGKNTLIIDAGSCITYDFVNSETEYLGGTISPGLNMRYQAMHTFTANLPLLSPSLPLKTIGDSTDNSMHSGVLQAVIFEIEGFVNWYSDKFDDLTVILTGGDAHFLRDSLKSDIFANSNFLLEGLNYILEHNKD